MTSAIDYRVLEGLTATGYRLVSELGSLNQTERGRFIKWSTLYDATPKVIIAMLLKDEVAEIHLHALHRLAHKVEDYFLLGHVEMALKRTCSPKETKRLLQLSGIEEKDRNQFIAASEDQTTGAIVVLKEKRSMSEWPLPAQYGFSAPAITNSERQHS